MIYNIRICALNARWYVHGAIPVNVGPPLQLGAGEGCVRVSAELEVHTRVFGLIQVPRDPGSHLPKLLGGIGEVQVGGAGASRLGRLRLRFTLLGVYTGHDSSL